MALQRIASILPSGDDSLFTGGINLLIPILHQSACDEYVSLETINPRPNDGMGDGSLFPTPCWPKLLYVVSHVLFYMYFPKVKAKLCCEVIVYCLSGSKTTLNSISQLILLWNEVTRVNPSIPKNGQRVRSILYTRTDWPMGVTATYKNIHHTMKETSTQMPWYQDIVDTQI